MVAEEAVVGDGEAVGFVADALDEVQGGGVVREADGIGMTRQKEKFFAFREGGHGGKAGGRKARPYARQGRPSGGQLGGAAVDQ